MSRVDQLRSEIARGHSSLRQAIEFAAPTWERSRRPRLGELEAWSPRQAAEHAIAADVSSAAAIARALGRTMDQPQQRELPDAESALRSLADAAAAADALFAGVSDEDLEQPADMWGSVEAVMKFAAWHLRDHARQIAGVEQ